MLGVPRLAEPTQAQTRAAQHLSAGCNIQKEQHVGYYASQAAQTCLNSCLVSSRVPDPAIPHQTMSYLMASLGRLMVKTPTNGLDNESQPTVETGQIYTLV